MKKRNKAIIGSAAVVAALVTAVGAAGVARGNVNLNDQLVGSSRSRAARSSGFAAKCSLSLTGRGDHTCCP